MNTVEDLFNHLVKLLPDLLDIRRHLHSHPELSGQEHQTAALIAGELRSYGWSVKESIGRTGVVADIGNLKGPIVGVRVDMDALPIEEKTGLEFASKSQGIMHACGHDLHICIGLGVARLLSLYKPELAGVRLIFQPAEEIAEGAKWMRSAGATKDLEALFGVHVFPELPVGKIGVKSGIFTAAAGELEIEIIGEAGHGARPHQAVDSIWIAARVINGLQEAISRRLDSLNPVVISFGKISGGHAFNVIADNVKLLGTVRCLDSALYKSLPSWIEDTVQGIASTFGASAIVKYRSIAPPVNNDIMLTKLLVSSAKKIIGEDNIINLAKPSLGAEDFADFLQDVPGTMFRLGVAGASGCAPLHNGKFCLDERSLEFGIKILTQVIFNWMETLKDLEN